MRCVVRHLMLGFAWILGLWCVTSLVVAQEPGSSVEKPKPIAKEAKDAESAVKTEQEPAKVKEEAKPLTQVDKLKEAKDAEPVAKTEQESAKLKEEAKPLTQIEKLKQAKDVFAGVVDAAKFKVGPGPVEERVQAFRKRFKLPNSGAGYFRHPNGQLYLIVEGKRSLDFNRSKPGWLSRRIIQFNLAEMDARVEMAKSIQLEIENGHFYEYYRDLSPEMAKGLKRLKEGAASQSLYQEATRIAAAAQVMGAVTMKTFEGPTASGGYRVIVLLVWSPKLRDLAINALADADYFVPKQDLEKAVAQEIPQTEAELVKENGCHVYHDERGQLFYVAFAQVESPLRNGEGVDEALDEAEKQAGVRATGMIARALTSNIASADMDQLTRFVEQLQDKREDKVTQSFYSSMESATKIRVSGIVTIGKWRYTDPEWKIPVAGAVVAWSPEGKDVVRELGLDKPLDTSDSKALAAYLTGKYGKPSFPNEGTKVKKEIQGDPSSVRESKDPDALP
ncbi:MAG: hypothetical protein WCJ35_03245 [Planctomycetota bacterium]